jgi:antitoxin component YwqK of YwqJK toxin-antitoxin module
MKAIVLFVAIILFAACTNKSGSAIKVVKDVVNNQKVEFQYDSIKKVKQGYYKYLYDDGVVAIEKNYVNDTADGFQKEYYPSGKISGELKVKKGKFEGDFKYYHENGKLQQEGTYVNNLIEGELKSYYKNGNLKEVVNMVNNEEKGSFTEYNENGKIKSKGEYLKGPNSEICILEKYSADGTIESKMLCDGKGACCTIWSAEKGDIKQSNAKSQKIIEEMKDKCPAK